MQFILSILIGLWLVSSVQAQQETLHGQLFDNHFWQNPAAAGGSEYHKIRMNYRMQWAQMTGAPHTATLSYDAAYKRVGFGALLQYDRIASFQRVSANVAYAYHIPLQQDLKLSIGLGLKYFNIRLSNTDDLGLVNVSDIAVINGQQGSNAFDAGAGAYLYNKQFFAGISVINLLEWRLNFGQIDRDKQAKLYRQYQAMAGYRFDLGKLSLSPSAYFRWVQSAVPQFDINVKFGMLEEQIFAGFSYRTTSDFMLFLGFKIDKLVHLGYSFEFSTSSLQGFHSGTHEVTIGVDLLNKNLSNNTKTVID
jgi:type IX secretion system PorP/SprF family membrane protein